MARALTKTLLRLDEFARILGLHPLHFNQVYLEDLAPGTICGTTLMQHSWQDADRTGREELAQAIADTEARLSSELGFPVLADFVADDRVLTPRPYDPTSYHSAGVGVRGQWIAVKARWGEIIAGGVEGKSVLTSGAAVSYNDVDGDGYDETATVTVQSTVTNPDEIAVYYPGESGAEEWRISPIKVSINVSTATATITIRRELLVKPDLLEGFQPRPVDGSVDANFLGTVDVYRRWHDPSQQVQMLWEGTPNHCGCGTFACASCYLTSQFGCLTVRDNRQGLLAFQPAVYNTQTTLFESATWDGGRTPDRLRLWYRAGLRGADAFVWQRAITYLAVSTLDRPICSCPTFEAQARHWGEDLAHNISAASGASSWQLGRWVNNPLGTTRAAKHAWSLVQRYKVGEAVKVA